MSTTNGRSRHNWRRVSAGNRCPVCNHPEWCSLSADGAMAKCMRVEEGCWRSGTDKTGARYYLHRLTGDNRPFLGPPPPGSSDGARADSDLLHRAYSALLAGLQLSKANREGLRQRGLSDEEIDRREYRTLPVRGRANLASDLREQLGDGLLSVPGFVMKPGEGGRPYGTIAGAAGLLIPVRDLAGRIIALKSRSDNPGPNGCRYSYLSSAKYGGAGPGSPAHVPLGIRAPAEVVRLTEGELKADVATALGDVPTIAAPSASCWRQALDALLALGCKTVRLAFDADALDNAHVARSLTDCCNAAVAAGLAVELERWNKADAKGIDDLLGAGKAPEVLTGEDALAVVREILATATAGAPPRELDGLERLDEVLTAGGAAALFTDKALLATLAGLSVADPAAFAARRATLKGLVSLRDLDAALKPFLREQARDRPPALLAEAGYRIDKGRICRERFTQDGGKALVPLCNFTARIIEAVTRDDGAEQTALFTVAGSLPGGRVLPAVPVPAADFNSLAWVMTAWHGEAVVYAGQGTRDHLRAAIELLSPDRARRTVYTHTGWRPLGDIWHYLHGGGAIGPDGLANAVEVYLPDQLAGFALPEPPAGEKLVAAIRASLALLNGLAPDPIAFPLFSAVFRAVLGETDFGIHIAGQTGIFKTELAALVQQHFGAALDARHLPGSWSSTGNALEGIAFTAKDAVLTVDDFAPTGSTSDIQRFHREADRILRAQGNRSGRLRMRPDATVRPTKPPRGLIVSTGEDTPRGQSLRSRLLIVELSPGDVNLERLTACQSDGADGRYANALAAFLRWLAPRYGEVRNRLRQEQADLRKQAKAGGQHARTPGIVADLELGLRYFLDFAQEAGAVTAAEASALWQRGQQALAQAAVDQVAQIAAAEPASYFLRLLSAALVSGRAHVTGPGGGEPENPGAWGWKQKTVGTSMNSREEWQPQGRQVGWLDGADLLLEPEASYAEAQDLARHQGEALPVAARTLWKRMRERGLLASWDARRKRNTIHRTLGGVKDREVLHLRVGALCPSNEPSKPSAETENLPIPT